MQLNVILFVLTACLSNVVVAETIWCKMFKTGCITEDQKNKQMRYCEQWGNSAYAEGLNEALAEPSLWQLAGESNAQAYARMRQRAKIAACLKTVNVHNF